MVLQHSLPDLVIFVQCFDPVLTILGQIVQDGIVGDVLVNKGCVASEEPVIVVSHLLGHVVALQLQRRVHNAHDFILKVACCNVFLEFGVSGVGIFYSLPTHFDVDLIESAFECLDEYE